MATLDLRWCKCLEKIFVLAIFSNVMFSISSSNLGCCTNWSNIIIPNMTYLAFFENRKIWLNLTYLVLSELHRFGSARTHKPRFWPCFSQRAKGDIWFSKPVTDDIVYIICHNDGSAGKLVCLSEPPGILHWSSFEYWCQWTIWKVVVALVDNDMPLSLSSVSLSMKMWQFQENDVYCEQFCANALLHCPILRSQFSNFDRYWVFSCPQAM